MTFHTGLDPLKMHFKVLFKLIEPYFMFWWGYQNQFVSRLNYSEMSIELCTTKLFILDENVPQNKMSI